MNILDYAASVPTPADWTAAFQQAIADLRTRGGGTLIVPAGDYPTGAIRLYDNMTLHIESGAVLRFHQEASAFPLIDLEFEGIAGLAHQPCIYAEHAKNVTITGYGTLDGQGSYWWTRQRAGQNAHPRPYLVCFNHCEHVTLENVTLTNSPAWTVHPLYCRNVVIRGLNIKNPADSPNTDGIDPESCEYIRIIGVNIHVGDDCIAMKASKVFLGMKLKKSCEHTVIRNCLLDKGHGGIVIGSEMSGGVKDMVVTQCLMDHTDRGLRVKTRRGRGNTAVIDGLVFRNVEMRGVKAPFVINMFYFCDPDGHGPYVQCRDAMPVDEYTPKLGSLTMEDIVATDAQFAGCYFDGLPEQPIERVTMKNVTITFDPNAKEGQAAMADNRPLVKKLAIYAENVKEIDLHNVKIEGYEGERLHFANVGHFEED